MAKSRTRAESRSGRILDPIVESHINELNDRVQILENARRDVSATTRVTNAVQTIRKKIEADFLEENSDAIPEKLAQLKPELSDFG